MRQCSVGGGVGCYDVRVSVGTLGRGGRGGEGVAVLGARLRGQPGEVEACDAPARGSRDAWSSKACRQA